MTSSAVNILDLKLSPEAGPYGPVFDIFIDGTNLLDRITDFEAQYTDTIAGAYAPYLTQRNAAELLNLPGKIMPYACDCGEPGCWFLTCQLSAEYGFVRWHGWSNPYRNDKSKASDGRYWRYRDFSDLVFEQKAYIETVEDALKTLTSHS